MYEEAIKDLETYIKEGPCLCENYMGYDITEETARQALDCIREAEERRNPQPLSLTDLLERIKKPVFVDEYYLDEDGLMTRNTGWDVIETVNLGVLDCDNTVEMKSGDEWPIGNAKVNFYDHEPQGEI